MTVAPVLVGRSPWTWTRRSAGGLPAPAAAALRLERPRTSLELAPLRSLTNPACEPSLEGTRLSRVSYPSALTEAGSYSPRGCLARVCRASRVSHPLDAYPSRNLSTVFQIENAPGLRPSKVSPFTAWFRPHRPALPAWRWLKRPRSLSRSSGLARLPGFALRESPLLPRRCYTGSARASLGLLSPSGVYLHSRYPGLARTPPLNLARVLGNRGPSPVLRSIDRE
jgi:hypothetical protein